MDHLKRDFIVSWYRSKEAFLQYHFPYIEDKGWGSWNEVLLSGAILNVSTLINNKDIQKKVVAISKQHGEISFKNLSADWDAELCPDFHPHWPFKFIEPEPSPWKNITSADQIEIAYVLTKFAGLTIYKEINVALIKAATEIARHAAGSIVDEFEQCGTHPRPLPKHMGVKINSGKTTQLAG